MAESARGAGAARVAGEDAGEEDDGDPDGEWLVFGWFVPLPTSVLPSFGFVLWLCDWSGRFGSLVRVGKGAVLGGCFFGHALAALLEAKLHFEGVVVVSKIGYGILVKTLVLLFYKKVKGAFLKPFFIRMMGSGLPCMYLLTLGSPSDEGFYVPLFLGSMALYVVLHFMHLESTLACSIEVLLSSMEGEMDVVGGDLSPIEVQLDA
ncbi:hypothetical protein SUGI_0133450 [Cryptomeria japonica]|nr:hypothetical protein SUGI_0133450 [Cryptomeria japonica]